MVVSIRQRYTKRDSFNFNIINFPHNIMMSDISAYGVYILSQLEGYVVVLPNSKTDITGLQVN